MSFKFEVTGLDELMKAFEKAGKSAEKVASRALYKGAGNVADSIRKEANGIKTEKFKYNIINFNYSNTVERLLNDINTPVKSRKVGNLIIGDDIGIIRWNRRSLFVI